MLRKILKVFEKDGKMYLRGQDLFELAPPLVLGSKDLFYEISEQQLSNWVYYLKLTDTLLITERFSFPKLGKVYEVSLVNKYINNELMQRIIEIGFSKASQEIINKEKPNNRAEASANLEITYINTIISLANDYIQERGMNIEEALNSAAIDLKCNVPITLIKATLKFAEYQATITSNENLDKKPKQYT